MFSHKEPLCLCPKIIGHALIKLSPPALKRYKLVYPNIDLPNNIAVNRGNIVDGFGGPGMIGFTEAALNGSDALTYFAIFHESGHAAVGLECRKQMIACPQPVDNPTIMQHECWADLCAAAVLKKHVKVMAATIKNEHVSIANSLGYGDQQHLSGTRRMKAVKKIIDDLNWVVLHK